MCVSKRYSVTTGFNTAKKRLLLITGNIPRRCPEAAKLVVFVYYYRNRAMLPHFEADGTVINTTKAFDALRVQFRFQRSGTSTGGPWGRSSPAVLPTRPAWLVSTAESSNAVVTVPLRCHYGVVTVPCDCRQVQSCISWSRSQ